MSKSHSRRSQHVQPEKPVARQVQPEKPASPPPADAPAPPPAGEVIEQRWLRPGIQIALGIWLIAFIAMLAWMVLDLMMGMF